MRPTTIGQKAAAPRASDESAKPDARLAACRQP